MSMTNWSILASMASSRNVRLSEEGRENPHFLLKNYILTTVKLILNFCLTKHRLSMEMDSFKVTNYLSKEGLHEAREGHYEINLAFEVLIKGPILPYPLLNQLQRHKMSPNLS